MSGSTNQSAPASASTNQSAPASTNQSVSSTVATHYNEVPEAGKQFRKQSRIFYMRNFNNWTKSVLINQTMRKIRESRPRHITVLDLCCGKGGDLLKWNKARIDHLVCVDIAGTSVEQCQSRHEENTRKSRTYSAEFHVADCTTKRLRDLYKDPNIQLDLVSCQFSFHYSFESYNQAQVMLRNASECLKPGGYFICTTLDSNELVKRWRQSDTNSFGNEVYRVTFESEDKQNIPIFGATYRFYLEGSVMDCPEFLVYFPVLVKLAEEHGLELVYRKRFEDYFKEMVKDDDNRSLLNKMSAMETLPNDEPVSQVDGDYEHAKVHLEQIAGDSRKRLGTLSRAEWEAITLYIVCAFRKKGSGEESRKRQHEEESDEPDHKRFASY